MTGDSKNPSPNDYRAARKEQLARERGKSLSHYSRKVTHAVVTPRKRGKVTPPKRAT